jgi:drug/metabolite transporter (DMT)-like permease
MFLGIIFVITAGFFWGINGIIFSYIAKKSMKFHLVIGVQAAWGVLLSWIFISNFQVLMGEKIPYIGLLVVVMIISGILCSIGMMIMQRALKMGHHGIVFTISQSAMIIPFLFGVFIFGDNISFLKWIGVLFVIVSFITFGSERTEVDESKTSHSTYLWFILTLIVFFILGVHQILMIIPLHWNGWMDTANIRIPLFMTGVLMGYVLAMVKQKTIPRKKDLWFGTLVVPMGFPSLIFFFKGMDLLASTNLVSLAYPVAVGTTIIIFMTYSLFYLRERTPKVAIVGVFVGIAGITLISI